MKLPQAFRLSESMKAAQLAHAINMALLGDQSRGNEWEPIKHPEKIQVKTTAQLKVCLRQKISHMHPFIIDSALPGVVEDPFMIQGCTFVGRKRFTFIQLDNKAYILGFRKTIMKSQQIISVNGIHGREPRTSLTMVAQAHMIRNLRVGGGFL